MKTNLSKVAVILGIRQQKAGFLCRVSCKITLTTEKERARMKKGGEGKKAMVGCTLSFYNGYCGDFGRRKKKLLEAKGPVGGNVLKKSG